MGDKLLTIWVIYFNPRDHPGKFVLRGQDAVQGGGVQPHLEAFVGDSLEEVRQALPPGLVWMPRHSSDDPVIVETWI